MGSIVRFTFSKLPFTISSPSNSTVWGELGSSSPATCFQTNDAFCIFSERLYEISDPLIAFMDSGHSKVNKGAETSYVTSGIVTSSEAFPAISTPLNTMLYIDPSTRLGTFDVIDWGWSPSLSSDSFNVISCGEYGSALPPVLIQEICPLLNNSDKL